MILWLDVVPMLRYHCCKGILLLPPCPRTRESPNFLSHSDCDYYPDYSATQATSSWKVVFVFSFLSFYHSSLMNYMDLERENLSWEMWNAMLKRAFLTFLFSCSSERDNSKCLRASQMEITSSTISSVMELRYF